MKREKLTHKTCNKCNENKKTNYFRKRSDCKDGFKGSCIKCDNIYGAIYRKKNSDKLKIYQNKYYTNFTKSKRLAAKAKRVKGKSGI